MMRLRRLLVIPLLTLSLMMVAPAATALAAGGTCDPGAGGNFFGLKPWYAYLPGSPNGVNANGKPVCEVDLNAAGDEQVLGSIWLIVLAVVDDLLRIAGILALGYMIYGSFRYILSQGEPDRTKSAQSTIINAFIGLAIVIISIVLVEFVAGVLTK